VRVYRILIAAMLLPAAGLGLASCMSRTPQLGVTQGQRLVPCPDSPNCVCSHDAAASHAIAPLSFSGDPAEAWERLRTVMAGLPRQRLVESRPGYLRYEFRSRLFRFVDDVELLLDAPARVIHVRSASRVGHSDLGVNRRRVEAIREAMAKSPDSSAH
jgi:uncharacterized protein (DUF1499 family)